MNEKERKALIKQIDVINRSLRIDYIKVQLSVKNNSLCLRYYDLSGVQKQISPPGVNPSQGGILKAKSIAQRIDATIKDGIYSQEWLNTEFYRNKKVNKIVKLTWGKAIADFPERWLKHRCGSKSTDRQKQVTLAGYITQLRLAGDVEANTPFDANLIDRLLATQSEGTNHRFRLREVLSVITNLYGITYNYRGIGKRPKPARRSIPSDATIIEMFDSFDAISAKAQSDKSQVPQYRWYFGLLATYGLRPQELFGIDLDKSFKPETAYWIYLDEKLTDGLKTGDRWVAPLHADWVALFDLANPKPRTFDYTDVEKKSRSVARYLVTHKIPCRPYDLRHAYAIRCRKLGIDLIDVSELMGHDPQTHHKQYHRWISLDDKIASLQASINRNT
jgi:integrase